MQPSADEKSMATSMLSGQLLDTGTPFAGIPASDPASSPICFEDERTIAAVIMTAGSILLKAISLFPFRPEAPWIASWIGEFMFGCSKFYKGQFNADDLTLASDLPQGL